MIVVNYKKHQDKTKFQNERVTRICGNLLEAVITKVKDSYDCLIYIKVGRICQ